MQNPLPRASTDRWGLRATLAGLLASGLGALVGTTLYLARPGAMRLDWSQMPFAIALVVLLGGISMGICVGGGTLLAARRNANLGGFLLAGASGGLVAGLAPGILGIAGFGSLDGPYMGTANILGTVLVGAISFVALWSPQLTGRREDESLLARLGRATVASIISLGAFGMMGWTLVRTFDLIPSFDAMAAMAESMGLLTFSLMVAAMLGTVGGAAIGAACGLVVQTRRR